MILHGHTIARKKKKKNFISKNQPNGLNLKTRFLCSRKVNEKKFSV